MLIFFEESKSKVAQAAVPGLYIMLDHIRVHRNIACSSLVSINLFPAIIDIIFDILGLL